MSQNDAQLERMGRDASPLAVPRALIVLALPIIASMISRTVMSFVDFVMVSWLGTEAQAAIMPAGILLFCVIAFGMGTLSVVNAFVAQSFGRGDLRDCSAYAWQGVHLSLAFGVLLTPVWFAVPGIFGWIGHEPAVVEMEIEYAQIGILGVAPTLAAVALTNFFNGVHRPSVGLWAALIANGFNVVANYALIFGHLGFPAMGMAGAAWATTIAAALQMLVLLAWMLHGQYAHRFASRHTWRPSAPRLRGILWFGLPAGAQFSVDIFAFSIFTVLLVGQFGTVQLAAHNLVFKCLEVSFMPTVGLGVAVTAAVGKAIGHGDKRLARSIVHWATLFGVGYMGAVAVAYVLFRHDIGRLLSQEPQVAQWAAKLLIFCAVFQVFDALGIIHTSALRGAGDNHWPAIASAGMAGTLFLGGGFVVALVAPRWGSLGPWAFATLYIIVLGLVMWSRWLFGPWERVEMIGQRSEEPRRATAT